MNAGRGRRRSAPRHVHRTRIAHVGPASRGWTSRCGDARTARAAPRTPCAGTATRERTPRGTGFSRPPSGPAHRAPRAGARPALRPPVALVLAAALATPAAAGVHRVTCKGIYELSSTIAESSCAESGLLDDARGRFLPGHSEARADRGRGLLTAAATGGAIRDVGYGGRDSTSLLIERLRLSGAWRGRMPVEITMKLRYSFGGDGESRLAALLRSSASGVGRGEHQAAVRMRYTELGGAVVLAGDTRGRFEQPADGRAASRTTIELRVIQMVDASAPEIEIRADLAVHAMPNLGSFEESLTSLVRAQGEIGLAAPCPFRIDAPSHAISWGTATAGASGREWGFRC